MKDMDNVRGGLLGYNYDGLGAVFVLAGEVDIRRIAPGEAENSGTADAGVSWVISLRQVGVGKLMVGMPCE